jgi:hypothetical protein
MMTVHQLVFYAEFAAMGIALCWVVLAWHLERRFGFWQRAEAIWLSLGLAIAFLFPVAVVPFLVLYGYVVLRILDAANAHKIDLTNFPVMPMDLRTAVSDPKLMFDITDTPHRIGWLIASAALAVSVGLLALLIYSLWQADWRLTAVRTAMIAGVLFYASLALRRFSAHLDAYLTENTTPFGWDIDKALPAEWNKPVRRWTPSYNSRLSVQLGALPFLLFKGFGDNLFDAIIFRPIDRPPALSDEAIASAIPRHERVERPNIVVMQLESLCNPNWAFRLGFEFESFLFQPGKFTRFIVPLRVNIMGGGSWVTEFEMLTGLDARIFGDDGHFTHIALPHLVREAFPAYLVRKGYHTFAFYSADGTFFNARRAYQQYGFEQFWDARDLALPGWRMSDIQMAEAFRQRVADISDSPFFAYIVTNGAHSPFRSVEAARRRKYRFAAEVAPEIAVQFTRYLALLRESEAAVQSVLADLVAVENSTGRPFVLLVYGDHQPGTFIRSEDALAAIRTSRPRNQTFAHMLSSRGQFDLDEEVPATLLPSILSAMVGAGPDEVYLPANFYLFKNAGPQMFAEFGQRYFGQGDDGPGDVLTPSAWEAQRATVHWLKTSKVLRGR